MELQQQLTLPAAPSVKPAAPVTTTTTTTTKSAATTTSTTTVAKPAVGTNATNFHLDCGLSYVSFSLLKEGQKFFETRVESIGAVLDIMEDTTMSVGATLKYFGVKDLNGTTWPEIVSTGGEKENAISFSYATFIPTGAKYPGYDMDIGIKMASVKVVFVNR